MEVVQEERKENGRKEEVEPPGVGERIGLSLNKELKKGEKGRILVEVRREQLEYMK